MSVSSIGRWFLLCRDLFPIPLFCAHDCIFAPFLLLYGLSYCCVGTGPAKRNRGNMGKRVLDGSLVSPGHTHIHNGRRHNCERERNKIKKNKKKTGKMYVRLFSPSSFMILLRSKVYGCPRARRNHVWPSIIFFFFRGKAFAYSAGLLLGIFWFSILICWMFAFANGWGQVASSSCLIIQLVPLQSRWTSFLF